MDRRLLAGVGLVAIVLLGLGFFWLDRPLAEWVHSSGIADARFFAWGLAALDSLRAITQWSWGIGSILLIIGAMGLVIWRQSRWPRALIAAALVQFATTATSLLGKDHFGRLRPFEILKAGDWAHVWHMGGDSFPSGHSAFYFGILLPLAAACPIRWLRAVLLAIPVFVILARIDLEKHFLSDVSASALAASVYALILATLIRRWLPAPATRTVIHPH